MLLPWILCGFLILIILALLLKLWLLQKSMDEICTEFGERLSQDTNNLIHISSQDRHARHLASEINTQLRLLRQQRRQFLNGDRELKEAVTNISHDLRTPLTAIYGYLDLLEQEEKTESVQRYLDQIQNRTDALKALTEQLFRYSVIVSVQEETRTDVVLNRILEESLVSCYGTFTRKHIEPEVEIPEIPIHRMLNSSALSRIFGNILSNAVKYSDGDLTVTLGSDGTITFTNSAKELTPVMVERLFDRFYTVETGTNSTGLGLSIAKLLTERMGGSIRAEYLNGKLSIMIYFPEMPG